MLKIQIQRCLRNVQTYQKGANTNAKNSKVLRLCSTRNNEKTRKLNSKSVLNFRIKFENAEIVQ